MDDDEYRRREERSPPPPPASHVTCTRPERVEGLKIKCEYQTNYANWHNTPDGFPVSKVSTLRYRREYEYNASWGLIVMVYTGLSDNREGSFQKKKRNYNNEIHLEFVFLEKSGNSCFFITINKSYDNRYYTGD